MKRVFNFTETKKAQAAMEFLMTYGWALLVVLVAIGALAFFGVLNPGQFLPDQCTMFAGITCTSAYATMGGGVPANSQIRLAFQNGLGYSVDMTDANCGGTCGIDVKVPATSASALVVDLVPVGSPAVVDCTVALAASTVSITDGGNVYCGYAIPTGVVANDRIKGTIIMTWKDNSGNIRSRTGSLVVTAGA